ncbi:Alanine-tRNA ligase [Forsythia ovata]|uniref:Alanine-tRNA ligase n=1 Tax=Forsythia ovata TaxID=205694 RepID=A0ABD1U687_9LAMI
MGSQATELEWPANQVRDTFIKLFEDEGHVHWTSSPDVPHNDPTLLFINADGLEIVTEISYKGLFGKLLDLCSVDTSLHELEMRFLQPGDAMFAEPIQIKPAFPDII